MFSSSVKLIERIGLSQEPEPILKTKAFCLTDDGIFIIPDYQAGNVKVYEKNGGTLEWVNTIGRKGYGPGEFSRPSFCFYNKTENKFAVMDTGTRKIFIYYRNGRIDFERIGEFFCRRLGDDIQLQGNRLFISGYLPDPDGNPYDFYYIDLTNNQTTFLLPSYLKYGLNSSREYENQFRKERGIPAVGINGWFDIYRDDAYFVWEGNLKIIKLNIVSREINRNPFGTQPPHYIKPYASQELIDSRRKRNLKLHLSEKAKMSYVRSIFVNSSYVLVIYEGPNNQGNASSFRVQFYTLDGDFIKEAPLPGQPDRRMWLDKDKHILYSLSGKSSNQGKRYYFIKYEVQE
jgi:hypothetical protein